MHIVDRVSAMRLRDALQSWYQAHEAQLSQHYESVRFGSSPADRSPPSAWIQLHSAERSGHLVAWDSGVVDVHVIEVAGEDVLVKHWEEIDAAHDLAPILVEFEGAFG